MSTHKMELTEVFVVYDHYLERNSVFSTREKAEAFVEEIEDLACLGRYSIYRHSLDSKEWG